MDLKLSDDQAAAVDAIKAWFWQTKAPEIRMGGYAGTGKTTVIGELLKHSFNDLHHLVCTPTNKAAEALRRKGVVAQTLHKLLYTADRVPVTDAKGKIVYKRDKDGKETDQLLTKLVFYRKDGEEEAITMPDLLVVDEASMVSKRIHTDILKGGYRTLYVGDHAQLPPINERHGLMKDPDVCLEIVHRQDRDLLAFCHDLRKARRPLSLENTEHVRIERSRSEEIFVEMENADVILCHKNRTRHRYNLMMLERKFGAKIKDQVELIRWINTEAPDDLKIPLVCLENKPDKGVFNGTRGMATIGGGDSEEIPIVFDTGEEEVELLINPGALLSGGTGDKNYSTVAMDLGYCMTVHKAQGSEFLYVCVVDDHNPNREHTTWRYTAATRAQERVLWLG